MYVSCVCYVFSFLSFRGSPIDGGVVLFIRDDLVVVNLFGTARL